MSDPLAAQPERRSNGTMLDPGPVRPFVANWEAVTLSLCARVRREALGGVPDDTTRQLRATMTAFPGVSELLSRVEPGEPLLPRVGTGGVSGPGPRSGGAP
ncbi:MAG TPA: hypothetical protein VMG12_10905 [Polyangiaceae bacterium]|nr:hypothetical protein [Polyangiaceae bacterium]